MALLKITTPVAGHTGMVGAVAFAAGVGYADPGRHAAEIDYCRRAGYRIDEPEIPADHAGGAEVGNPAEMPKKSASTETWRAWAAEHGGMTAEEADTLSRDQLVERFTMTKEG